MNLNNLFENREPYQLAIDKLEARRIEDLEMKMDDLAARAKESKDPKHVAALRQEFAKAKAERDSYHRVNEHGGGGGDPAEWHAYVKAHRADEGWSDAIVSQRTGQPRTPYSIYIKGKKWKDFETDDHAEAVANKLRAKFKADGRDPETITVAPTDMSEAANPAQQAAIAIAKKKEQGVDEGYHADTIGAMAKAAPTFKVGDAMWTRDENGKPVSGEVVELRPGAVVFKTEDGRKFRAPEGRVMKRVHEGSMSDASHHETGPKFGGYYKGTQVGAPRPGQSFGAESKENQVPVARNFVAKNMKQSGQGKHTDAKRAMKQGDVKHKKQAIPTDEAISKKDLLSKLQKDLPKVTDPRNKDAKPVTWTGPKSDEDYGYTGYQGHGMPADKKHDMEEGAKVDRMVRHIEKSERATGKSKKDAEAIAWATANKRGMLDNVNKKDEGMNFMEWAVAQGSRFNNFTNNPEVYAAAKEAYVAEGMSNALSNITRRMAQPVNAKTIIKNREQKKKTIKTQNFAEDEEVDEDWQKANKKDKTDGMSQKAVNAYKRENPGSKLKTAVTTKPSKLKKGSKASKRRSSYCSRSKGQQKMHNISCAKTPDKAICKARRRWNCESQEQFDAMLREAVEKGTLQPGQYYIWKIFFDDGSKKQIKVTKDNFDPKAYYAKQNKIVVNVDYDWTPHGDAGLDEAATPDAVAKIEKLFKQ